MVEGLDTQEQVHLTRFSKSTNTMKTYLRASLLCALLSPLAVLSLQAQMPPDYPPYNHGGESGTISEGAPASTVNNAAADTMDMGGLTTPEEVTQTFTPPTTGQTAAEQSPGNAQVDIETGGGHIKIGDVEADIFTFKVPYSLKLSDRSTLQFSMPLSYASYDSDLLGIKNAKAYGGGLNLGYAFQAITKTESKSYRWKLTPSMGTFYRDCSDLNQGSWVFNVGLSSSFAWQFSPGWVLNIGNSFSTAWNSGIKSYPDPIRDNQQMVTNGIQLYRMIDRWTVYGYIMDTEALKKVLVDSYQTYAIGLGFKLTKTRSIKATLIYENGSGDYSSFRGTVGTTWQF